MLSNKHPLAEVFGFPINNVSKKAIRYRKHRLCPFNNKVPSCTKDKAQSPLGVCSVYDNSGIAITCPIRFREDWIVAEDAANFFFKEGTIWTSLTEIRLNDQNGKTAGNIDLVLVAFDDKGKIIDFGALEIQAVYISGNIRRPFEYYQKKYNTMKDFDWTNEINYPRPDYLSSSRKRLVPQLLYKGSILNSWDKKICVAIHEGFFNTLPDLPIVDEHDADVAWHIYSLEYNKELAIYNLSKKNIIYTRFHDALNEIIVSKPGNIDTFINILQSKLDEKLEKTTPPDAPTLEDILKRKE